MFCQSCGKQIPDGSVFCHHCGSALPGPGAATTPSAATAGIPAAAAPAALYAGFWLRFVAILIDSILFGMVIGVVVVVAVIVLAGMIASGMDENVAILLYVLFVIPVYLLWYVYFAFLESSSWQASLGKRVVGLYVTDVKGNRITFARAAGRAFGKMVTDMTFFIGYIMAGFTDKRQALHDIIADCLVLRRS